MAKGKAEFDIIVYGASGFTGRLVAEMCRRRRGEAGGRWLDTRGWKPSGACSAPGERRFAMCPLAGMHRSWTAAGSTITVCSEVTLLLAGGFEGAS